ncbi:MAG: hypothetical protein JXA57_05170 [Armatimonadetes bacterium]|nr:hypothetical protein [Armatimonadota bacterium]
MDAAETAAFQALVEYVKPRMGVLVADSGRNQFSCTFARFRGRYLAVTAAHCLARVEDWGSVVIGTFQRQSPAMKLTARALHPGQPGRPDAPLAIDVGAVELDEAEAMRLGVEWFGEDAMMSRHTSVGAPVCVAGFPWELFSWSKAAEGTIAHPGPFAYVSVVSDRLPSPDLLDTPSDPLVDFYVEYNERTCPGLPGMPAGLRVHPLGMSGSGVFVLPRPVDGQVWSVSTAKLAGVQSSYVKAESLLRCSRVEHLFPMLDPHIRLTVVRAPTGSPAPGHGGSHSQG